MSNSVQQKIVRFLREQILMDKPTGKVARLELRHLPVGSKQGNELDTITPPDDPAASWFETQGAKILETALSDAHGIASGAQRYVLQVYRSKEPDRAVARHAFLIAAPDAEDGAGFESEPPTKDGLLAQAYRHLEKTEAVHLTSLNTIMGHLERMANNLSEENEHLRNTRAEMFETFEQLLSQRDQRALEQKREEAKIEMWKESAPTLKNVGAAVVHKLTGGAVPLLTEGGASPDRAAIDALVSSLSDEERKKFLALGMSLSADKQALLLQLMGDGLFKEH